MNGRISLTFVSPRFLFPTDSGGKIRTTQILRGLKESSFSVTLVMPGTDDERSKFGDEIEAVCDRHITWERKRQPRLLRLIRKTAYLAHRFPVSVQTDWDTSGALTVRRALDEGPDVVVFDFPHSAVLAPERIAVPSLIFTHNIEAEIFQRHWKVARSPLSRMVWRSQYKKMLRFEKAALSKFDAVIAVSDRDAEYFLKEYDVRTCGVIPTGVDTEFFAFHPPKDDPQVVFCGSMDWMANIDAIEYFSDRIWPKIKAKVPRARMKVVGRSPRPSLIKKISASSPEFEFTGFVDDVRQHVCGSAAFVIPLRVGGGTRIKAFEAMAMGVPVVSTAIGIEGLPVRHGVHFLLGDDEDAFAENVVALLKDRELRTSISRTARKLVDEEFGFRNAAAVFERICLATAAPEK